MIKNVYFVQGGRYILHSLPCVVSERCWLYWNRSGACKHVRMMLRNWDLTTCHVVVSLTRGFPPNVQLIGAIGQCAQLSGRCIDISCSITVSR